MTTKPHFIEVNFPVDPSPAPVSKPTPQPLFNDYANNGHTDSRDPQFRWNGPHVSHRRPAFTNMQLQNLRDAAAAKGRALTDAERLELLGE